MLLGITKAEVLLAYEGGYRFQPKPELSFDATAYIFDYDKIIDIVFDPIDFSQFPPTIIPVRNDNSIAGEIYGVEFL